MLRHAPLFPAALVFGAGCALGLWSGVAAPVWWWLCGALALGTLACWRLRTEGWSLILATGYAALLFLAAGLGAERVQWIAPDDLRRLGEAKRDPGTEWRGVVISNPVTRDSGRTDFYLQVQAWRPLTLDTMLEPDAPWQPVTGEVFIEINPRRNAEEQHTDNGPPAFHYGQELQITGGLDPPRGARNPGQFDWRGYLAQREVFYTLAARPESVTVLNDAAGYPWTRAAAWAQGWTLERLRLGIDGDPVVAGLIGGMLLGYTHDIPDDLKTAFYNTETYHIFAVSGQNVGVLLVMGLLVLRWCGLVWWRWAWVVAPLLIFYVLVTGNQPSAVRALAMALLVMLAWRLERPVSVLNLWSMALLAVLAVDPLLLGDLGFQLSFTVVLALILLSPPIYHRLVRPWLVDDYIPRVLVKCRQRWGEATAMWVCGLVAGSIAAWIGATALIAFAFQRVSPIGLLANLWVVPLASLVVVIGTVAVLVSLVAPPLAALVNLLNWAVVKLMVLGVVWLNSWPGAYFYVPSMETEWRPARPELICADAGSRTLGLLRHGDRAWLLNVGNDYGWTNVMNPMRQFYGINELAAVFVTEPSSSYNGAIDLAKAEKVSRSWLISSGEPTSAFDRALRARRFASTVFKSPPLRAGFDHDLGDGLRVRVLSPLPGESPSRVADRAAVLLIEFDGRRVLWATRIGFGTELQLMEAYPDLTADVLVQGPHGSEDNRTGLWLMQLQPRKIVVPAPPVRGRDGGPLDLSGFADGAAPEVLRQGETGAVILRWTEDGIEARPFLRAKPAAAQSSSE